jgi:hypothetical protein
MLMHCIAYDNFIYCFEAKDREFSKPQRIKLTNSLIVLMPVETKARKY